MRKILFILSIICTIASNATEQKWALTTQSGESVFMDQVGYILYSDGSSVMSIVKKDNSAIENVTKIVFSKMETSSISDVLVNKGISVLSRVVDESLRIKGCQDGLRFSIVSASGAEVVKGMTHSGQTDIDVSGISTGVYVLVVGETKIKFIKK
ncbi:MAG: T9SS type A sorting domain-containing protein [Prevotella sp.]|nr:T9SS type A sorting domain-containing protein [Prevotella sp.]